MVSAELTLLEMRTVMEQEKQRFVTESRRLFEQERKKSIEETKKKQWVGSVFFLGRQCYDS